MLENKKEEWRRLLTDFNRLKNELKNKKAGNQELVKLNTEERKEAKKISEEYLELNNSYQIMEKDYREVQDQLKELEERFSGPLHCFTLYQNLSESSKEGLSNVFVKKM